MEFTPVLGTREDILSLHQQERDKQNPPDFYLDQGRRAIRAEWKNGQLIAMENTIYSGNSIKVDIFLGEQTIYSISIGAPGPINNLRGFWVADDQWVLEVAVPTQQQSPGANNVVTWNGKIIMDGESINDKYGYKESFGYQLLQGKPFYFFNRDGKMGFVYSGQEVLLGYDLISHYGCCSASELNPIRAENMVAFFAQRDEVWYYVEIGVFE